MPTLPKRIALAFLALAILFNLFFQTTKHNPSLSAVNPFAEDPYDAIGSFSVQFVLFIALLSLLRAFRPYGKVGPLRAQEALFTRGLLLGGMAMAITLLADIMPCSVTPTCGCGPSRAISSSLSRLPCSRA